jgi:hypothetical protein
MYEQTNNLLALEAEINPEAKAHLDAIGKWAVYSAAVSFVSLGVNILTFIVTLNKVSEYGAGMGGVNLFQTFLVTVVSLLLNITLYMAGTNIKKGLLMADQGFFNVGLKKLNNYFMILGILMIIVFSIVLLVILFGGLASLMV